LIRVCLKLGKILNTNKKWLQTNGWQRGGRRETSS
jgi:hypothetical protein